MAEASSKLEGSDFEKGFNIDDVADGKMLLGHAFGEDVLVARRGDELFAIGATCTHYGGPLAKGLMVDCTVRCPWHHARFDLRTGEAIAAPALNHVACYKIKKRGEQFFVTGKINEKPVRKPKSSPASVVIVGAGAAGGAAAEMLRREGYDEPVTLIGADEFLPYDRPNLSKDYLAGTAPEEWIPLRSADFYRGEKIDTFTNTSVTTINPQKKKVTLSDGRSLGYGALLLATGAEPVRLAIPGDDLPHVCYLRTLADSRRIIDKAKGSKRGRNRGELHRAGSGVVLAGAQTRSRSGGKRIAAAGKSSRTRTGQLNSRNRRSEWREISSRSKASGNSRSICAAR